EDLEWFNPAAREAAVWTQNVLTPENAEYTRGLPKGPLLENGFAVIHGAPFDEDEYMVGAECAGEAFGYLETRVAFFVHTHLQGGFIWNQSRVETIPRVSSRSYRELLEVDSGCAYLINPGSVGQPRDGDPRAAYAVYDSDAEMASYYRVAYDIEATQKK